MSLVLIAAIHTAKTQSIDAVQGLNPPLSTDSVVYFQLIPESGAGTIIDALFALSEGPVTAYADCSTILRFNNTQSSPYLDVHDGGYTRTNNVEIELGSVYHCWFDISFETQTYSTYVMTDEMESPTLIHEDAAFRKSGISSLALWTVVHYDPSSANTLQVTSAGYVSAIGEFVSDGHLTASDFGELDHTNRAISNIPPNLPVKDFIEGITYFQSAALQLEDSENNPVALDSDAFIETNMTLTVTGIETSVYALNVRPVSDDNQIISAFTANLNHTSNIISGLDNDIPLQQFKSGIILPPYASARIINDTTQVEETDPALIITTYQKVEVTSESGLVKEYNISIGSSSQPTTFISNSIRTFDQITLENYDLGSGIEWHISTSDHPLPGSRLNIMDEDVWIYFENIKPQDFFDHYLSLIHVNGHPAELDVNLRLVQYGDGCVIIGHSENYEALTVYSETNLSGDEKELDLFTYHRSDSLKEMEDNISSFILKKGYMATLAANTNGTGASEVYIASQEDLIVNELPTGLAKEASFVRVIPWRWVNKKSFSDGNYEKNEILNSSWRYNWDNSASSTLNIEYVPMRHNPNWPAYSNMTGRRDVTHALHFNEPDNPVDDGYSTVEEAIRQWPNMLATGLRIGTPAPTDGGVGWLYDFIDACEENNYRVDFVAIHFYRGGQSTTQFYNFLKAIHDRTGLPIWVTEWNNGANWTCCDPTYESQAQTISDWVDMLEAAPFVERYALYGRVEETRQMFYGNTLELTPAGEVYRDKTSTFAYQGDITPNKNPFPADEALEIQPQVALHWNPSSNTRAQQVYFGDSYPPEYHGYLAGKSDQFQLEELDYSKTYYWRVDEYIDGQWVKGEDWEFQTITFIKPYDPSPADQSDHTDLHPILSWSSDTLKSQLHHLYLGETPDDWDYHIVLPDSITSYEMDQLKIDKHYYWKVDEQLKLKNGEQVTIEGDLWEFSIRTLLHTVTSPRLKTYPVPATHYLKLDGLAPNALVEVYDLSGNKLLSTSYKTQLDLKRLPHGLYIIRTPHFQPLKIIKQ